jgi:hypothetical protein
VARVHGRNGSVYLGVTNAAAASQLTFASAWTISNVVETAEVTAFGDSNKVYVAGLPDASGDFTGFLDDATSQTYRAAVDGLPRNFYLYPDITADPNLYWFGTILPDFSADGSVSSAVNAKSQWKAASAIQRYTAWGGLNT